MSLLAFDEKELVNLLTVQVQTGEADPDHIPEPPDDPITQKGDLWILGDHRLLCGDSANPDDVDYLVDGNAMHITCCDPPYNVRVESRSNNAIAAGLSSFGQTHHQQFDAARKKRGNHLVIRANPAKHRKAIALKRHASRRRKSCVPRIVHSKTILFRTRSLTDCSTHGLATLPVS